MKYAFLLLNLSLLACQKDDQTGAVGLQEKTMLNVSYGNDPAQKMDIYLPPGRSVDSTKVMLLIHGGGWTQGDKVDFTPFIDTLKRRLPGYAFVNINYRLANGSVNSFPAQENDIRTAVEFVFNKNADYGISHKFVLMGASAGGHLALLQAYKYPSPVSISAVIDFFGPVDITDMYNHPADPRVPFLLLGITGGTPTSHPDIYQQSGPINYVTAASPPTLILQGGMDPLVSPSQSVMLDNKLETAGVAHQYVFYPNEAHGWTGPNLTDSFDKITAFLTAHVD